MIKENFTFGIKYISNKKKGIIYLLSDNNDEISVKINENYIETNSYPKEIKDIKEFDRIMNKDSFEKIDSTTFIKLPGSWEFNEYGFLEKEEIERLEKLIEELI